MVFARILFIEPCNDVFGGLRLDLLTETGFWHEAYSVRLFPSHLRKLSVAVGDHLDIEFYDGSSNYRFRKVKRVEKSNFDSCTVCRKFIRGSCPTDHSLSQFQVKGLSSIEMVTA